MKFLFFKSYSDLVVIINFSLNNKMLVLGLFDKIIKIWNYMGVLFRIIRIKLVVKWVSFSLNGKMIVVVNVNGIV